MPNGFLKDRVPPHDACVLGCVACCNMHVQVEAAYRPVQADWDFEADLQWPVLTAALAASSTDNVEHQTVGEHCRWGQSLHLCHPTGSRCGGMTGRAGALYGRHNARAVCACTRYPLATARRAVQASLLHAAFFRQPTHTLSQHCRRLPLLSLLPVLQP